MKSQFACPNCARMRRSHERYGYEIRPCGFCTDGQVVVDIEAIIETIAPLKNDRRVLRASRPRAAGFDAKPGKKPVYGAAYCWRMIRFDSGADMHLPVMAPDYVGVGWSTDEADKPLMAHLDAISDAIGNQLYGRVRMLRGAAAWGSALGFAGAEQVKAAVDREVGMPLSPNGFDVRGADESPEAALEAATDGDGNVDFDQLLEA